MKSLASLLCIAALALAGCATQKACPMVKKSCDGKTVCCASSSASCPMKKHKSN